MNRSRFVLGFLVGALVLASATGASAAEVIDGLTVPSADPALVFLAPHVGQPDYAARATVFVEASVPDVWSDQPVGFLSAFTSAGGVDVLGLPTSRPAADPANPSFVYQRFQGGILFYNASDSTTSILTR